MKGGGGGFSTGADEDQEQVSGGVVRGNGAKGQTGYAVEAEQHLKQQRRTTWWEREWHRMTKQKTEICNYIFLLGNLSLVHRKYCAMCLEDVSQNENCVVNLNWCHLGLYNRFIVGWQMWTSVCAWVQCEFMWLCIYPFSRRLFFSCCSAFSVYTSGQEWRRKKGE